MPNYNLRLQGKQNQAVGRHHQQDIDILINNRLGSVNRVSNSGGGISSVDSRSTTIPVGKLGAAFTVMMLLAQIKSTESVTHGDKPLSKSEIEAFSPTVKNYRAKIFPTSSCSSVIVSDKQLLTAKHCVPPRDTTYVHGQTGWQAASKIESHPNADLALVTVKKSLVRGEVCHLKRTTKQDYLHLKQRLTKDPKPLGSDHGTSGRCHKNSDFIIAGRGTGQLRSAGFSYKADMFSRHTEEGPLQMPGISTQHIYGDSTIVGGVDNGRGKPSAGPGDSGGLVFVCEPSNGEFKLGGIVSGGAAGHQTRITNLASPHVSDWLDSKIIPSSNCDAESTGLSAYEVLPIKGMIKVNYPKNAGMCISEKKLPKKVIEYSNHCHRKVVAHVRMNGDKIAVDQNGELITPRWDYVEE